MKQQSAWSRNQNVDEAGARAPEPPPSAAAPSTPPAAPDDRAVAADERRSPLCGSSDFIIAAAGSGLPLPAAAHLRAESIAPVGGWGG
uniref:Uncharacterized protein n=1 Tax=Arundo donax TaxID=35708 RepID=A0A0A9GEH2_ARUDO